ncbi:MAG: tRNA (adenosine(37)-N6)-threonylcarbamoyltransferase complex dimerization subunit type 1 TsaB [Acidobacteriota bacterium]
MNKQEFTTLDPVILALHTSSETTSVAVSQGAKLLRSIKAPPDEKRSDKLWSDVQALLVQLDLTISDVEVYSVCVGPGSFTGLRVGMAAVKGFSAANNKPIVAVTSLEAAAFAAGPAPYVCAIVNAYKGEVYSQLFSFDRDGVPAALNDPMMSSLEQAVERVADVDELVLAGGGAAGGAGVAGRTSQRVSKQPAQCPAEDIAALAFLKNARGQVETAESLKACYVRPSEAEIKLSLGLLGSKIKRSMKLE